jgi:hypothetical protein
MDKKTVSEAMHNLDWACRQFRDAYSERSNDPSEKQEREEWLGECVADLRQCMEELRIAKAEGRE